MHFNRSSKSRPTTTIRGLMAGVIVLSAAFAGGVSATMAQEQAADPAEVIGTLNGKPITRLDLDMTLNDLGDQLGQVPPEGRDVAALTALIDIRSLAGKAEEAGMDESDEFQKRLAFLRERALHNAYFQQEVLGSISDEDVRARYDKEVAATPPENEVRARHILLESEDAARKVIADLDGGADFETLAKENSTGPSAPNGGDLGYFTRGRMVPEFEEAAFSLDVGSYTKEPVQTQFGWHVIKVEDKRAVQPPAFEEVADQIRAVLMRERYFGMLADLRDKADIEIADPELREAYEQAIAEQKQQQQQQ